VKALELVEADPDRDLSMRALADSLGVAPMSLYRHVRNKEDLLDGVTSRVLDQLEVPIPTADGFADQALGWMHAVRSRLHEHPAVMPLLRTSTHVTPALLRLVNSLLVILRAAGFEDDDAVRGSREIMWFTFGFVFMEIRTLREFPDVEVGALHLQTFPAPDSPEASEIADLVELLPYFLKGDAEATFSAGARHLVAGLAGLLDVAPVREARR